jgi:hypothetical protein
MAQKSASASPLQFVGPPGRMTLISDLEIDRNAEFTADKALTAFMDGVRRPFRVRGSEGRGARRLKLKLNPTVPPGQYKAVIGSGDARHDVVVTVQRAPRVSVSPSQLQFTGAPSAKVEEAVTFWNRGNVAFTLPDFVPIGLFDDDGLETAIASTYRQKPETLEEIAGHFFSRLREAHGGMLKLSIASSSMSLEPGMALTARVGGTLPGALKPGHGYHGVWSTDFANIGIGVSVTSEVPS